MKFFNSLEKLEECVVNCRLCPRLVAYRESVTPKKGYENQDYWKRPVPGFGDPHAWLLITGLAPSAHGGNRTGRIFTGDQSGKFLFNALYKEGLANQPTSDSIDDGLQLKGCFITAAVKCAPPHNKPTSKEFSNCSSYYHNEHHLLKKVTHVLALGKLAFDAYLEYARKQGASTRGVRFVHGASYAFEGLPILWGSYHPSPQNTQTGKLSEAMFRSVLRAVKKV